MAEEASYRDGREHPSCSPQAATEERPQPPTRRRLSPSELHAMRVAWGKKWGKLVSDAVRESLEGTG